MFRQRTAIGAFQRSIGPCEAGCFHMPDPASGCDRNSTFKCGHDAPTYGVIESIIEQSGTPYFCFKDLDENKPAGSIRLRIETIDYCCSVTATWF